MNGCPRCLDRWDNGCQGCNPVLRNGVHGSHCCLIHGCKYGDDDCPVEKGEIIQDGPDEYCWNDAEEWPSTDMAQLLRTLDAEFARIWTKDENGCLVDYYSPEERSGRSDGLQFAIDEIETRYKPKYFERVMGVA